MFKLSDAFLGSFGGIVLLQVEVIRGIVVVVNVVRTVEFVS